MASPDVGDGKTTVSTNLAIVLARINQRVLLVDGDTRCPGLHRIFGLPNDGGFLDLLGAPQPIEEMPAELLGYPTAIPGLHLLPAGTPHSGQRLLHSDRASALFKRMREEFDVVLVDSPPMAHFSDARVLGHLTDGVVLVFRAGRTTVDLAMSMCNCLAEDGTQVVGTVLNDWDARTSRVYGRYQRKYKDYGKDVPQTA
jgi:capsular exopolysaccharide synthesis family protein